MTTRTLDQMVRFAVGGIVGYVVDAGVLMIAAPWAGPYAGRLLSFAVAVISTWLFNRFVTFHQQRGNLSVLHELARYFAVCLGGGSVNLVAYSLVVYLFNLTGSWLLLAVAAGSLAGMTINFTLSRRFVFRGRHAAARPDEAPSGKV